MERKYYAISNPIGCLLYYFHTIELIVDSDSYKKIIVWFESQVNGNESIINRVIEKYRGKLVSSLECILSILTECGWQLFYIEPLLNDKVNLLLKCGLIEIKSNIIRTTKLGRELLLDESYNEFVVSLTKKANYWKFRNVMLYSNEHQGIGSGFFVSNKEIATCRHVVDGLTAPFEIQDERGTKYTSAKIRRHPDSTVDLSIIEINEEYDEIPFLLGDEIGLLEKVCVFGYPPIPLTTRPFLITNLGEISAKVDNYIDRNEYLILSCIVKPGNSGGPVINEYGKVVGIITQNIMEKVNLRIGTEESVDWMKALGYSAAIPVKYLKDITA